MKTEISTYKQKSKSLAYTTTKTVGGKSITVKIRLNDNCKNGHQEFAITGDIYQANKPKIDKYHISCGCIHDDIAKHFPNFKQFIKLHLCDYLGNPMYATANGFYHLTNGFNNTKPSDQNFKNKFCDYYRVTPEQFEALKTTKNKIQYALKLIELKVPEQWKAEANKAIKELERLTDTEFIVDSKRDQFGMPSEEEIKEELERQASGYYTETAIKQRENEKINKRIEEIKKERDKKISDANICADAEIHVLKHGGEKALNNMLFHDHSKTFYFNWKSFEPQLTDQEIEDITNNMQLPEGVKIENKRGK